MKNSPEKILPATEKDPASAKRGKKQGEVVFTPPAEPAVKAQKGPDKRDEEVVKDGSEFELTMIDDVP